MSDVISKQKSILVIEDNEGDFVLLRESFRDSGKLEFKLTNAKSLQEGLTQLEGKEFHAVILDLSLPESQGLDTLVKVKIAFPKIPTIILSGTTDEDLAAQAVREGAQDYFVKGEASPNLLIRALRYAVERLKKNHELEELTETLQRTANELLMVYQNVTDIIYHLGVEPDEQYRFLSINPAFTQATGLGKEQVVGKLVEKVIPESSLTLVLDKYKEAIRDKKVVKWEEVSVYETGTKYGEVSVAPVFDNQGNGIGLIGTVHDITDRIQADKRVQTQLSRLQALHNIDLAIAGSLDLNLNLNVVLDQVITQLGVDAASVLLLSPYSQVLTFGAASGFRTAAIEQTSLRLGEGLAGMVAQERKFMLLEDIAPESKAFTRTALLDPEGFIDVCAVPLIAKGKVSGVLEVFNRKPIEQDLEWKKFLITLGGQAAIAIDSAQLFEGLQNSNNDLIRAYDANIESWSRALDLRDKETEGHSKRVTDLALVMAKALAVPERDLVQIKRGALLHDIGKMGVPDAILLKPGKLTDEEWVLMRKHPQFAFDLLAPITFLQPALDIPYCHHEKWDGTGYPRGLKGETIPLAARIFAVVDVYDALTSDRPYRAAWSRKKALDFIKDQSGSHFDPQVAEIFLGELQNGQS